MAFAPTASLPLSSTSKQQPTSDNATLATPTMQREEHTVTRGNQRGNKTTIATLAVLSAIYALWYLFEYRFNIHENISEESHQGMAVFSSVDVNFRI